MMADFDYDTEAIVAEYDSMAHYRGPTALPPVPRIIETQFGLRPGPIFHQHPEGQKYFCPELVKAIEKKMKRNRRKHAQLPLADRRDDEIYRPAAEAPLSDRVCYAAAFFYSLVLFYDAVNEQRNIRYFENRQDGVEVFRGLKNLLIQSVDPVAVASTNEPMVGDALKIVIQEIVPEAEETWNTIRVVLSDAFKKYRIEMTRSQ